MSRPNVGAPDAGATGQAQGYSTADAPIVGDDPATIKRFANIQAHLALRGYALYQLAQGGFLIASHQGTAHAPDLRACERFLEGAA